jgi:hypothetical protein
VETKLEKAVAMVKLSAEKLASSDKVALVIVMFGWCSNRHRIAMPSAIPNRYLLVDCKRMAGNFYEMSLWNMLLS